MTQDQQPEVADALNKIETALRFQRNRIEPTGDEGVEYMLALQTIRAHLQQRLLPVREGTFAWHLAANGMDMADATGRIVGAIRHTMGDISAYHDGRLIGSYLTAALAKAAVQRAALGDIGA